jgi:hypothetical protein
MRLLRRLGFWINYNKVEGPSQRLVFLGILLDTVRMRLELPLDKIKNIKDILGSALKREKLSKRYLQHICGKLNYASQCIYGGRFFLRRLLDCTCKLAKPWHRTRNTAAMKADMTWWLNYMDTFNGKVDMVDSRPVTPVFIDSCQIAAGAFYKGHCVYTPWLSLWPEVANHHINYKEVLALEPAVTHWASWWRNRKVYVYSDNQAAVAIINRGSCRDCLIMQSHRRIFWLSATYNFRLKAVYIPGKENIISDAISRSHEPHLFKMLCSFLNHYWNINVFSSFHSQIPDVACRMNWITP